MKILTAIALAACVGLVPFSAHGQPVKNSPKQISTTRESAPVQQRQGEPPLPFKAPPGSKVTITSSYSTYNFSGLNREIPLPMEDFIWKKGEVKEGYKIDTGLHKASKKVVDLYNNLSTLFPESGTPKRVITQAIKGKQGPGTILYVEYNTDLPADARVRIIRKLYGVDVTPEPPGAQIDQHFVSKNMFIIWSFKDTKSLAREAHQKKTFDLVSMHATAWEKTQPKKTTQAPAPNQQK